MASKQVDLPNIGMVTLTKRRSSKNIRLSYTSDGVIKVSLPYFVPYQAAIAFVKNKSEWLAKHRPEVPDKLKQSDRIGKAHRLNFTISDTSRPSVRVTHTQINVTVPEGRRIDDEQVQEVAIRGSHRALKKEANQLLPQRIDLLAKKNGFNYSSVEVKRLTSRWGSCSQHKEITLNTYLMQLPWDLIDYVILHELVHTEHLNHSPDFWYRFEQVRPDAKKLRKELKKHKTIVEPSR